MFDIAPFPPILFKGALQRIVRAQMFMVHIVKYTPFEIAIFSAVS